MNNGNEYQLFINTTSGSTGKTLAHATSCKVSKSNDGKKFSSKDTGGLVFTKYGKNSRTITTENLYELSMTVNESGITNIEYMHDNKLPVWLTRGFVSGTVHNWTLDTTKPNESAFYIISQLELTASEDEYMTYSATFDLYSLT
jgi:hypothetical protein